MKRLSMALALAALMTSAACQDYNTCIFGVLYRVGRGVGVNANTYTLLVSPDGLPVKGGEP